MTEIACGNKEFDPPFPFPPRASRGGVGSPHAGSTLRAKKRRLARIDAAGSPHKESARVVRVHTREELGSRGGVVAD
jgi:hypothetical protein